mmetsp:Transcript_35617/g.31433  ORF Transcript_35617/g.31433 Transcript_35617/m.31433 type:complete len:120 (-) Transcript_35617:172-531(-)
MIPHQQQQQQQQVTTQYLNGLQPMNMAGIINNNNANVLNGYNGVHFGANNNVSQQRFSPNTLFNQTAQMVQTQQRNGSMHLRLDPHFDGTVSIHLENIPVDKAMSILQTSLAITGNIKS